MLTSLHHLIDREWMHEAYRLTRKDGAPGVDGGFSVPLAAFKFAHGGPRIDTPPPALGQHNDEIFAELGFAEPKRAKA